MLLHSDPVGLPGLAALAIGYLLFFAALFVARRGRDTGDSKGGTRAGRSAIGIAVQMLGVGIAAFGPILLGLDPLSGKALAEGAAVLALMLGCVALFVASTRAMGRNWSIVARTRADHQLVTAGPFAHIRHPIYTGIFLMMLGLSLAFGHTRQLLAGVPLYALGTWLRIGHEERLLAAQFGDGYAAYAARVKRFVPGLF